MCLPRPSTPICCAEGSHAYSLLRAIGALQWRDAAFAHIACCPRAAIAGTTSCHRAHLEVPWRDEIARPARAHQRDPCARVLGCAERYLPAMLVSSRLIRPQPCLACHIPAQTGQERQAFPPSSARAQPVGAEPAISRRKDSPAHRTPGGLKGCARQVPVFPGPSAHSACTAKAGAQPAFRFPGPFFCVLRLAA